MSKSPGGRLAVVGGVADFIQYAHSLRHEDAPQAVAAAKRAIEMVEGSLGGGPVKADLRCRAWGVFGNSLRITGAIPAAQHALDVAEHWRLGGSGRPELEVMSLSFRASLAIANRSLSEADRYLQRAEEVAFAEHDAEALCRTRVKRAIVATYRGAPADGAQLILSAMEATGTELPLDLRQSALETLMSAYALAGESRKALEVWLISATFFAGCGDLMRLKLRWVRGLIDCQLFGRQDVLLELQAEYLARGMGYLAALVGLDLAVYAAEAGDQPGVGRHLAEAEPILRAYGVASACSDDLTVDVLRSLRLALSAASRAHPTAQPETPAAHRRPVSHN